MIILGWAGSVATANEGASKSACIDIKCDLSRLRIYSRNAAGNGETDDTEPIQAAINYVARCGGGSIIFPAGILLLIENSYIFNQKTSSVR